MVLAATALLERIPQPRDAEIKKALEGHLCRCTGYNKIVEAVELAAGLRVGDLKREPISQRYREA
jgi:carbon-monoxide dehydrogenase small subunit